jgi:acyl-CoA synthetase (AMP-forming)/AMP-acid ligase II
MPDLLGGLGTDALDLADLVVRHLEQVGQAADTGVDELLDGLVANVLEATQLVDDAGHELPPDNVGEIAVRGPNVFFEYWGNEQATGQALRDGWRMECLSVPAANKPTLRYELFRVGVHESSMFPDIVGLATRIRWQHSVSPLPEDTPNIEL